MSKSNSKIIIPELEPIVVSDKAQLEKKTFFNRLHCLKKKYPTQPNIIWFVVLESVRTTASFTAIIVIDNSVRNAQMNIRKVRKTITTKWSLTDNANHNFLKRNASFTKNEMYIYFVKIVMFHCVLSASS